MGAYLGFVIWVEGFDGMIMWAAVVVFVGVAVGGDYFFMSFEGLLCSSGSPSSMDVSVRFGGLGPLAGDATCGEMLTVYKLGCCV